MFVGLDLGTTNVKAVLAEADGRVVARGSAPVQLIHVQGGGIEQDIEEIWQATLAAIRELAARRNLADVEALGISAQGAALQLLDGSGRPLGRVISWLDGRAQAHNDALTRRLGRDWLVAHTGHGLCGLSPGQVLRLREENPRLLCLPNRIGFVGDVIVSYLCGQGAHDATSLSIALLYNPSLRTAETELLELLELAEEQLPRLVSVRTAAGGLLQEVARKTGLPAGIPVSAAVHDQYAAALGAGVIHPGDVMFGAGTAWVLLAVTEQLTRPAVDSAFVCTHLVEGRFGQMVSLVNGGSSFAWAAHLLGLQDESAEAIDAMIGEVQPGSDGLRFWPLLAPGGGAGLAPGTSGRLMGLRLSHDARHILRAVVEGLALELARYLKLLADKGIGLQRLVMCGGGAAGRVTPQVVADAAGLEVTCAPESDVSALGAAMIARGLVEPDADLADLSRAMASPVRAFTPGPDSAFYRSMLDEYMASLPKAEP
jgi:xylulokinase